MPTQFIDRKANTNQIQNLPQAAGVAVVNGDLYVHDGTAARKLTDAADLPVTEAGVQTLTGKTLDAPIISGAGSITGLVNLDSKNLAADFTAAIGGTGATLTNLTGLVFALIAGATYRFRLIGKVIMTTNGGLAVAFKLNGGLTLTSLIVNVKQMTASAIAVAQSTTASDQSKFINQKAVAYIYVEVEGSLVVNAAGSLQLQAAQETAHADTSTVSKGFLAEFVRTA